MSMTAAAMRPPPRSRGCSDRTAAVCAWCAIGAAAGRARRSAAGSGRRAAAGSRRSTATARTTRPTSRAVADRARRARRSAAADRRPSRRSGRTAGRSAAPRGSPMRSAAPARRCTPDTGCGLKLFPRALFLDLPLFRPHAPLFAGVGAARGRGRALGAGQSPAAQRGVSKYGVFDRLGVGIADLFGVMWLRRRALGRRDRRGRAVRQRPQRQSRSRRLPRSHDQPKAALAAATRCGRSRPQSAPCGSSC